MNKKIIAIIGAVSLLSACETASQKVVTGTSATSGSAGSASASSSVDKRKVYSLLPNKLHLTN